MDQLILVLNKLLHTTFVIVSHELASIFKIAHRVLLFEGKRQTLVAQGDPRELGTTSTDPWVKGFFNREIPQEQNRLAATPETTRETAVGTTAAEAPAATSAKAPETGPTSDSESGRNGKCP